MVSTLFISIILPPPKICSSLPPESGGTPCQGCVLCPLLFAMRTQDYAPTSSYILQLQLHHWRQHQQPSGITDDETKCKKDITVLLSQWCQNLFVIMGKTAEIAVDFRRGHPQHPPLTTDGVNVERVYSMKFLGVHITEDLF